METGQPVTLSSSGARKVRFLRPPPLGFLGVAKRQSACLRHRKSFGSLWVRVPPPRPLSFRRPHGLWRQPLKLRDLGSSPSAGATYTWSVLHPRYALTGWPVQRNGRSLNKHWRAVLVQDPCVYCGGTATGLDHIQASSRDGADGWANRAPACRVCDELKGPAGLLWFIVAKQRAARQVSRRGRYKSPMAREAAWRVFVRRATNPREESVRLDEEAAC